jgi:hypothetical protein
MQPSELNKGTWNHGSARKELAEQLARIAPITSKSGTTRSHKQIVLDLGIYALKSLDTQSKRIKKTRFPMKKRTRYPSGPPETSC